VFPNLQDGIMTHCGTGGVFGLILCGLSAAGCAKGPDEGPVVVVRGHLTNAGQPLTVKGMDFGLGFIEVRFCKYPGEGKPIPLNDTFPTQADASGNFKVLGRFGNGIPPGKYRIAVRQWDPYPSNDALGGKFDVQHSPLIRDISRSETLEIDLAKP
jgi:hypothetical protein